MKNDGKEDEEGEKRDGRREEMEREGTIVVIE